MGNSYSVRSSSASSANSAVAAERTTDAAVVPPALAALITGSGTAFEEALCLLTVFECKVSLSKCSRPFSLQKLCVTFETAFLVS